MGLYKYLRQTWKNPTLLVRQKLIQFRKEPAILKIKRPTRLDKARSLGYRAKIGIIMVRVRVKRGGRMRPLIKKSRKSRKRRRKLILNKNYQTIAEERTNKNYKNLEVLNSYLIGKDGIHSWYEVILVDPSKPEIKSDKKLKWICSNKQKGRVFRGLTSAAKKGRGLRKKGKGAEKLRPSRKAHEQKRKRITNYKRTRKF